MLYSVVDWATATEKSRRPAKPPTSLTDLVHQVATTERVKKQLKAWKSVRYLRGDDGFEDQDVYGVTIEFLTAWRDRNYGALADLRTRMFARGKTLGEIAGEMRLDFGAFVLTEFEVIELENEAPTRWEVRGIATVNGESGSFECRWTIEDENGDLGYGRPSGKWRIVNCSPSVWRRSESAR